VQPIATGLFAGRLDFGKLPFLYRIIAQAIGEAEADYRKWEAIKTWAGELVTLLGDA
jgi:menaquinone-dependent protoporphyrinogen IX oxidase